MVQKMMEVTTPQLVYLCPLYLSSSLMTGSALEVCIVQSVELKLRDLELAL